MTPRSRAYTLIEVAVASVMASILTTAGLSAFVIFNKQRVRIERSATADDTAKVVLQYLIRELQRIGGATLRPWQAIAVEQDPECIPDQGLPCVRGDRITFAFIDERAVFESCTIESLIDDKVKFKKLPHLGTQACCNLFRVGQSSPIAPSALRNTHLMLSSTGAGGTSIEQFRAVTYSTEGNAETCVFPILTSGQVRPLSSSCVAGSSGSAPEHCEDGRPADAVFDGVFQANAMPITVATAYIGCTSGTPGSCDGKFEDLGLFVFSDRNAGENDVLTVDAADDNFAVSPNIMDLQVALGYDRNDDGELEESIDGDDDDYAGNKSPIERGDEFTDFARPTAASVDDPRRLRMIHIGVMAAIKVNDPNYTSEAQLPGAPPEIGTALHLRALTSKAAFRSLNLLE